MALDRVNEKHNLVEHTAAHNLKHLFDKMECIQDDKMNAVEKAYNNHGWRMSEKYFRVNNLNLL